MEIAGYIASAVIGISMGLIGGGGSILTIPILVYLFGMSPTISISYSLFIVGFSSLVGAINNYRRGLVDFKTVVLFGSSSVTTVFISRRFIIPNLPDVFFRIGNFTVTHGLFVMVVFAILMLAASISMIRSKRVEGDGRTKQNKFVLIIYGVLIGLVTGFLGAGGGFLLVPALVLLMKLPMKEAIGTSLFIIALNSLIGFTGDIGRHEIHWQFLLTVTAIAVAGVFVGIYFNKKIDGQKLKKGFGWFVLAMAIYVIAREMFFSPHAEKRADNLKAWQGEYNYDETPVKGRGSTMMMQWQFEIKKDPTGFSPLRGEAVNVKYSFFYGVLIIKKW